MQFFHFFEFIPVSAMQRERNLLLIESFKGITSHLFLIITVRGLGTTGGGKTLDIPVDALKIPPSNDFIRSTSREIKTNGNLFGLRQSMKKK